MFIVSLTYVCELSEVEKYLDAHIEYLDRHYSKGTFLASGRKVPRTGGVILAKAGSLEKLEQILAQDPFCINKLADYEITEFVPSKTSSDLEFLRDQ